MATLPLYAHATFASELGPNLVKDAGFEKDDSQWHIPENTAEVVDVIAHTGTRSLQYHNTDEKQYKMFSQQIDVKPGQHLRFSAWVRGENIVSHGGPSEGASIYVQTYAGAKYLNGSFPMNVKGTFGWKQISGEYTVPTDATNVSIGLYLRKSVTGKVWFDDVEARITVPVAVQVFMRYPNYRGLVPRGNHLPWKFDLRIGKQDDWKAGDITITNKLINTAGKVLLKRNDKVRSTDKTADITFQPPQNLPVGKYTIQQKILNPNGEIERQSEYAIQVVEQMPKVYIDPQGFTVSNGKRFFPFGVYLGKSSNSNEDMQRISKAGFNTILSYSYGDRQDAEDYLQRAANNNLKVVYSIKDMYPGRHGYGENAFDVAAKYIKLAKNNPTLLAWGTNDEMDANWLPQLQKMYSKVTELDPDHPTYQVLYQMDILEKYISATDILATDPYPISDPDLAKTSADTRATVQAMHGRGVWMVPQMMDWAVYREKRESHPPSLDEMRNQAYQTIINGTKGIIWYSYYDLKYKKYPRTQENIDMDSFHRRWTDVAAMAQEIGGVIPVILEDKMVQLNLPANHEIQAAAWRDKDELLIVLANPYYEQKSITFAVPKGWKINQANQVQIKSTFADDKVTFTLPPVGSGVFKLN